jgi:hypothetical protein
LSGWSSPGEDTISSLLDYTAHLQARRDVLARLSQTSAEIRARLEAGVHLAGVMQRRQIECDTLAALNTPTNESAPLQAARQAATTGGQLGETARTAISLWEESQALAEGILTCQTECEAMLKSRIEKVGRALKESSQRRRLDAAYGPACRHGTPAFLDAQK